MEDTEVEGPIVYLVWYNNGEPYEDNYSYPVKIFYDKADAVKWLDERYCKVRDNQWMIERHTCKITGSKTCDGCAKYDEWMNGLDLWSDNDEPCEDEDYDDEPCEEYQYMVSYCEENESWSIEEMNMTIRYPGDYSSESIKAFKSELYALEKKYGIFIDSTYVEDWDEDYDGTPILCGGDSHVILLDANANELCRFN